MGAEQSAGLDQGLAFAGLAPGSPEFVAVKAALNQNQPHQASFGADASPNSGGSAGDIAAGLVAAGFAVPAAAGFADPDRMVIDCISDTQLLTQLVQALSRRSGYSLLLSDLGVLLPKDYRQWVKEKGGLRSWLQRHPDLFRVAGQPGKESVTLMIGSEILEAPAAGAPGPEALDDGTEEGRAAAEAEQARREEEEADNEAAVQLRGLPYRATINDIRDFLGEHAQFLKEEARTALPPQPPIQLVLNRDGRPSGFAKVQFTTPEAAKAARDSLHNGKMDLGITEGGSRYVEIFLFAERPNKLRFKRTTLTDTTTELVKEEEGDPDPLGVTRQQVYEECVNHMNGPGKGQLLLSMLGVALSVESRAYLKRTDQGLKAFLCQYASEFLVDGAKGRECVYYLPVARPPSPMDEAGALAAELEEPPPRTQAPGLEALAEEPAVPESPKHVISDPLATGTPKAWLVTPSDWGTPQHFASASDPRAIGRPKLANSLTGPEGDGALLPPGSALLPPGSAGATSLAAWGSWTSPDPLGWTPTPWGGGLWPEGGGGPPPPWGAAHALAGAPFQEGGAQSQATLLRQLPPWGAALGATSSCLEAGRSSQQAAAVRLRGLPFDATEQDVLNFFSKYNMVELIEEGEGKVRLLTKPNGRSSGQAVVWMQSYASASAALQALHGQHMRTPDSTKSRYIEVFFHEEERDAASSSHKAPRMPARSTPSSAPTQFGRATPSYASGDPEAWLSGQVPPNLPLPPGMDPIGLDAPPLPALPGLSSLSGTMPGSDAEAWRSLLGFLDQQQQQAGLPDAGASASRPARGAPPPGAFGQQGGPPRTDSM